MWGKHWQAGGRRQSQEDLLQKPTSLHLASLSPWMVQGGPLDFLEIKENDNCRGRQAGFLVKDFNLPTIITSD